VPHSVRPGDVLAGRYRLVDLLAESGGGRFWRARDSVLERHVAVHVISAEDERAAALLEAARRSAAVHDQRILRVLDAEQVGDICYVINEWGSGTSLDTLAGAIGAMGPRRAAWLVAEVADSVAAAHAAGVAHGRLVPENVLIDRHGEVKIIGMCVDAAMHGLAGDRIATDVSDLAGLLYCALTGRWGGVSASSVPSAPVHHGEVLRPRRVRAGIPGQLDALCDEVLHAHHNSRRAIGVGTARGISDFLAEYVGDPTGMADALRETVPPLPDTPKIALPALVDPAVRTEEPGPQLQPGPAPDPEPKPEAEPEPDPDAAARPVEELPTEAGLPIFGDGIDDVSWLEKRSTPAPPPPPFEKHPERPLFAPEPEDGGPARRPRPGVDQRGPSADAYWPFDAGQGRSGAGATSGSGTGTGAGLSAVDDEDVPGRNWLRLAAGIAAGLMLLVAVVVAYNLGRGKTPLGAEPDPDPTSSTTTESRAPSVAPVSGLRATDLDPQGEDGSENPEDAPLAVDGDPQTAWSTVSYEQQLGPAGLKTGVGLVVDLGAERQVTGVVLSLVGAPTGVALYLTDTAPTDVVGLEPIAADTAEDEDLSLDLEEPTSGRFLVVWLTSLPADDGGFQGGVTEVRVEAVADGQ
jgi:hypothetical protein